MLGWGADWLSDMANKKCRVDVQLRWDDTAANLKATIVDEAGRVINNEVKTRTETSRFMFDSGELASSGVPIRRGLIIRYADSDYEVVMEAGRFYHFNDVYQKQTVIVTKHVSN